MNVNDTERMYALLEMSNYTPVSSPDQASVIVINACSVREKPVHKVYSEVGRYKKLKEKNPNLLIGVGGCVGQQEKGQLIDQQPMIDFVFGTDSIDQLPAIIASSLDKRKESLEAKRPIERVIATKFKHPFGLAIDPISPYIYQGLISTLDFSSSWIWFSFSLLM